MAEDDGERDLRTPRAYAAPRGLDAQSTMSSDGEDSSPRAAGMKRSLSNISLDDMDNVNTSWVGGKGTWCMYLLGIFVCRLTLHVCGVDRETAWTALNLSHAGFSFYYVHWLKGMPMFRGTPDYDEKYDRLTFWEQLDGGTQYTLNKKFLTIIPIVLFLFTISNRGDQLGLCGLEYTSWRAPSTLNLAATIIVLVPKSPLMHGKRILNINSY